MTGPSALPYAPTGSDDAAALEALDADALRRIEEAARSRPVLTADDLVAALSVELDPDQLAEVHQELTRRGHPHRARRRTARRVRRRRRQPTTTPTGRPTTSSTPGACRVAGPCAPPSSGPGDPRGRRQRRPGAHVPQGDRPGPAAHRLRGGGAGQAHRVRRPRRRADGRSQRRPASWRQPRVRRSAARLGRAVRDGEEAKAGADLRPTSAWSCRSPSATWAGGCCSSISSRRATSASCVRSTSSTTRRASSSPPTRRGGSARRSPGPSPTRPARSASRCTWSSRSTRSTGCSARCSRSSSASRPSRRSPTRST